MRLPDTVQAVIRTRLDGLDGQALELLLADVLVFEQGRVEKSRTEYAKKHLGEDMSFASSTQRSVSRRSAKLQGNTAWVMSVNRNKGKFNNRPVDFTTGPAGQPWAELRRPMLGGRFDFVTRRI